MSKLETAVPKPTKKIRGATRRPLRADLRRNSSPKKVNRARKAREFARCYHSPERVEFVKRMPCFVCGVHGYTQNAHLPSRSGMRRKGDYTRIVNLCGIRPYIGTARQDLYEGCHAKLEARELGAITMRFLDAQADCVEHAWLEHQRRAS